MSRYICSEATFGEISKCDVDCFRSKHLVIVLETVMDNGNVNGKKWAVETKML